MFKYALFLLQAIFVLAQDVNKTVQDNKPANNVSELSSSIAPIDLNRKTTIVPSAKPITVLTTELAPDSFLTSLPPAITTQPPSTTTPAPKLDKWVVNVNGTVCIIMKMDLELDLKIKSDNIPIKVPKDAHANGTCGEKEQNIDLYWEKNRLSFTFKANETTKKYFIDSVAVDIQTDNKTTVQLSEGNITMFETAFNHSYLCSFSDPLRFTQNNDTIKISFSSIKLVAFKNDNSTSLSNVSICNSDTPDLVPIVVGCALTVLVVAVLIAYLISRRRNQARGYLSM